LRHNPKIKTVNKFCSKNILEKDYRLIKKRKRKLKISFTGRRFRFVSTALTSFLIFSAQPLHSLSFFSPSDISRTAGGLIFSPSLASSSAHLCQARALVYLPCAQPLHPPTPSPSLSYLVFIPSRQAPLARALPLPVSPCLPQRLSFSDGRHGALYSGSANLAMDPFLHLCSSRSPPVCPSSISRCSVCSVSWPHSSSPKPLLPATCIAQLGSLPLLASRAACRARRRFSCSLVAEPGPCACVLSRRPCVARAFLPMRASSRVSLMFSPCARPVPAPARVPVLAQLGRPQVSPSPVARLPCSPTRVPLWCRARP
jgi:hypothetical protein